MNHSNRTRWSKKLLVGVHVQSPPNELKATLDALGANTEHDWDMVLLVDGADGELSQSLHSFAHFAQSATSEPAGAPACFNRLIAHADAGVYAFLESGSIVTPGWWWYIAEALRARNSHGLAGPSTNSAWNEQCAFPSTGNSYATILRNAAAARRKFGATWLTLSPLYSLADFCFVVGRDVVRAIGAADEGYGFGPCWEMDYNIRAARAGFDGVWARGAYVHRLPRTDRRSMQEANSFDASRKRYQDKFCALRLDGKSAGYETHCKGDVCAHFAPSGEIRIRETPVSAPRRAPAARADEAPLVSCVMATSGRPDFARQAIRYFQQQDVASKELIIIGDGAVNLGAELDDPQVKYVHLDKVLTLGAKRNIGCNLSRGEFIVLWDDDDWYGPQRVSHQIAPLLQGSADMSALRVPLFFDLARWRFWQCSDELHRQMFFEDVPGGTLAFRRAIWSKGLRYPDKSLAEDAAFLGEAMALGARLARLEGDGHFFYLRHAANTWMFECGDYLDPRGWVQVGEPPLPDAQRSFYLTMMQREHRGSHRPDARQAARAGA